VLIGDSTVDLAPYRALPNMHFLGRKPYADLPGYCKEFDVGLVPFKINELTKAVNPIKLREYLAAGLPVVSTPLPEARLLGNLVEVADTPQDFEAALAKTFDDGTQEKAIRTAAMATETWPEKVAQICLHLSGATRR
jgi:glycosyltransferase involved in cell wall biosynthesis